jgi:NAD(P)-dependent dehydrogenase (short-subunit alcohol dehydrogenase family)
MILVTGTSGLAKGIAAAYNNVTCVSRRTGHNINDVSSWGEQFLNYNVVYNNAYDAFGQVAVLEFFFNHWKDDVTKTIISIGSRAVIASRSEISRDAEYWPYRLHKQALSMAHDTMIKTAKCRMLIVNPGAIDTEMVQHLQMPKLDVYELGVKLKQYEEDTLIRRIDLWL